MGNYYNAEPFIMRLDSELLEDGFNVEIRLAQKVKDSRHQDAFFCMNTNGDLYTGPQLTVFHRDTPAKPVRVGAYVSTNNLPLYADNFWTSVPFILTLKWIYEDGSISRYELSSRTLPISGTGWETIGMRADGPVGNFTQGSVNIRQDWHSSGSIIVSPISYVYDIGVAVFMTETELDDYLNTGNEEGGLNPKPVPEQRKNKHKYIYSRAFSSTMPKKGAGNPLWYHKIDLFYDGNAPGWSGSRPVAGWIKDSATPEHGNIELIENDEIAYYKDNAETIDGELFIRKSLSDCDNPNWMYKDFVPYSGGYLYGDEPERNIPLFKTRQQALDYLHGKIGASDGIDDEDNENETGEDVDDTGYNSLNGDSIGSEVLCMNATQCQTFFNELFGMDSTKIEAFLEGLKFWGQNPNNFLVDYFAIPFDAADFMDLTAKSKIQFGFTSIDMPININAASKLAPKLIECFSVYIEGGYNDWRDYACNYYVFLPYAGLTHLDINKYLYKTLSCKCQVDVRTGHIKYHLYANGIEMDTYETVCRISLPMTTTNMWANTVGKINDVTNMVKGAIGGVSQAVTGDFGGLINSAIDYKMTGAKTLMENPPFETHGTLSPSNAWLDPATCYLYIETPMFTYNGISGLYNLPDNTVGTIGSVSGFVQADDVKLSGCADCSEQEKNTIKALIKEGLFV